MATRLYLRSAFSAETTPTAEQSTTMPVGTLITPAGSWPYHTLSTTIGASQSASTGGGGTTNITTQQSGLLWSGSSPRLGSQTIAAATWTFAFASIEGNAASNQFVVPILYVWRPGTGAKVGTIYDNSTALGTEWSTVETGVVVTFAGASLAVSANDILVLEAWVVATQSMGTSYVTDLYYEGATAPTNGTATSDAASYLENPNTISFNVAAASLMPFAATHRPRFTTPKRRLI